MLNVRVAREAASHLGLKPAVQTLHDSSQTSHVRRLPIWD